MQIINIVPEDLTDEVDDVEPIVRTFIKQCVPIETDRLHVFVDSLNNARYCECHIRADRKVAALRRLPH